eukprot:CAMPEP_0202919540 /NCGR_PEP_ID=MMETSP1392-20130828/76100_1 /ASSEMBLY_ACC=CAM_ASM_000868 /TAXON_ID=225041 /ORGANISM="Chlamydomonas chlamydogama, Strain SAG 11-48b" /LENGTH=50 /DNA_ID=CAMNT_0049612943 /DNA_START=28 /DNA_END=180 /DNA_ORIENTATION=+
MAEASCRPAALTCALMWDRAMGVRSAPSSPSSPSLSSRLSSTLSDPCFGA